MLRVWRWLAPHSYGADPTVDEYVLYQKVKERVLYIVERDREKRVTGGGRQRELCESTGALWATKAYGQRLFSGI
jgi:hypothetical protein